MRSLRVLCAIYFTDDLRITWATSLLTDERLRLLREDGTPCEDVWAIGDAAVIKDGLLPATAQGTLFFS